MQAAPPFIHLRRGVLERRSASVRLLVLGRSIALHGFFLRGYAAGGVVDDLSPRQLDPLRRPAGRAISASSD